MKCFSVVISDSYAFGFRNDALYGRNIPGGIYHMTYRVCHLIYLEDILGGRKNCYLPCSCTLSRINTFNMLGEIVL